MTRAALALALVAACAHHPHRAPRRPIDHSIRAIDFANRPYYVRDVGVVQITGGRGVVGTATLVLDAPQIADLDRDGSDDALVTGTLTRPGADPVKTITIYAVADGSVRLLGTIKGTYVIRVWLEGHRILTEWARGRIFVYGWEEGRLQQVLDEEDDEGI